jgi:hypothetical protein
VGAGCGHIPVHHRLLSMMMNSLAVCMVHSTHYHSPHDHAPLTMHLLIAHFVTVHFLTMDTLTLPNMHFITDRIHNLPRCESILSISSYKKSVSTVPYVRSH